MTDSDRSALWASALWEFYEPHIRRGGPFYLAADESLISSIYNENVSFFGKLDSPIEDFHASCDSLFERTPIHAPTRARVREHAFAPMLGGTSRAICLAVQQVLVVESMLVDDFCGANAYFPRYRSRLGLTNTENSNPLRGNGFLRIWDELKAELLRVPGSSSSTITFEKGRGSDLRRKIPLSQALLTGHDLTRLVERNLELSVASSDQEIRLAFHYQANRFTARGQKIVQKKDKWLSECLCNQVRSFIDHGQRSIIRMRPEEHRNKNSVIAFLEAEDFFSDEETFCVYVRADDKQVSGERVQEVLSRRLSGSKVIPLGVQGDCYLEITKADVPQVGDPLLLLANADSASELQRRFSLLSGISLPFVERCSNLNSEFRLLFCDSVPDVVLSEMFGDQIALRGRLQLKGGLRPDERQWDYIAGYPPSEIEFDGVVLESTEHVSVDGQSMECGEFLEKIRTVSELEGYSLEVCGVGIRLAILPNAPSQGDATRGYPFKDSELGMRTDHLSPKEFGLRGMYLRTPYVELFAGLPLKQRDLVSMVKRGRRIALTRDELSGVLEALSCVDHSPELRRLAQRQIQVTKSLPLSAYTSGFLRRGLLCRPSTLAIEHGSRGT